MNKINITILIIAVSIIGCKSQSSNHTHLNDDKNHTHESQNYFESYTLEDSNYGTKTIVTVKNGERKIVTNALPNHKTGDFPRKGNPNTISAQNRTYILPVSPKYIGKPQWVREPGVALNGVKFEPQTAEVVVCETGENYRVEAIQNVIDLGLDFNHAHVQPTGAYHYHGTPTSVIEKFDSGKDLVHIGFAQDGFPMYYSKSGAYKPSYKLLDGTREGEDCVYENPMEKLDVSVGGHHDGTYGSDYEFVANSGDLDECNGITIDGKYMYLVTDQFPYVSRCLMGEFKNDERKGPPRNDQKPLSISELFIKMDANKDNKLTKDELKGPLVNEFSRIDANNDGFITKLEFEKGVKMNLEKPKR